MPTIESSRCSRRQFMFRLPVALGALAGLLWLNQVSVAQAAGAAGKSIRVACVGDSITYGYSIKDRLHHDYPHDLGKMLGAGWEVRNFGHSGATLLTKANLPYIKQKEYKEALAFKPNIVVIMLGTNDSKHRGPGSLDSAHAINNWQYKADFIPDYENLIASFRKVNPAVKVYVCLPTPCFPGRWGINGKTIHDEIIPMTRQVAKATHSHIIDLYSALEGKGKLFHDTVHPDAKGAKIMAATIYHALTGKTAPQSPK